MDRDRGVTLPVKVLGLFLGRVSGLFTKLVTRLVLGSGLLLLALFSPHLLAESPQPLAREGLLNLSEWDFLRDGNVELNGEYEFYWQQFLDRRELLTQQAENYAQVPGEWNDVPINDPENEQRIIRAGSHGYATYRLNVLIAPNQSNLALKVYDFGTAARIFIDGKLRLEMGRVSSRADISAAHFQPTIIEFSPKGQRVELVFHVSNFDHRSGGIWLPMMLGEAQSIRAFSDRQIAIELLLFGAIIMIAVFNLALFALRPTNLGNLFLSIFCVIAGIRILSVNERFLFRIFPDIDWASISRIEYLSWYLLVPFLGHFLLQIFPRQTKRWVIYSLDAIVLVATLAVLMTPLSFYSYSAPLLQIVTLLAIFYGAYCLVIARKAHEEGADLMVFGFLFLLVCAVNDLLLSAYFIDSISLLDVGVVAFTICHTILASYHFARSLRIVEQQHEQLATTSIKLRTQEKLRQDAEQESRKVSERFKESQHFEALGILAHGVVSELKESVNEAAREVEVLARSVKSQPDLLASIEKTRRTADRSVAVIEDLLSLSDFDNDKQKTHPNDVIKEMVGSGKLQRLMKQRGIQLQHQLSEPIQAVAGSKLHIQRIIENLLENAASTQTPGGIISIATEQTYTDGRTLFYDTIAAGYYVILSIEDQGQSIHPEDLNHIFQPFFVRKHAASDTRGLGMSVVRAIVRQIGGGIDVISEEGKGTRFDIYLRVALPSRSSR